LTYVSDGRHEFTGAPVRIGAGAPAWATDAGDLYIQDRLEVDGPSQFDGIARFYGNAYIVDGVLSFFEGANARAQYAPNYTFDQFLFTVSDAVGTQIIITEFDNRTRDHDHANQANPTLFVHSTTNPNTANDEWVSLTHDVTNAVFGIGSGLYDFTGGDVLVEEDLAVLGMLNVDHISIFEDSPYGTLNIFAGVKMGAINDGNYTEVESDGTVVFYGDATVWDDLRVPVNSVRRLGFSDPDWVQFRDDGAASVGVYALAFDDGTDEEVFFTAQIPHAYREASSITPHVHWSPSDGNAGNVTWKLEYTWANIDGTFGNTSTVSVTDSTDSTSHKHLVANMTAISGAGKTISSMLQCRLYRDVSDGDDYASDAFLHEIDFHFELDTIGSREISTK
jgi:hypothetical protein